MEHRLESCQEILALLSEYVDFDLPPEACGEVADHLSDCPPCVEFVESLRETIALCHGYTPDTLPSPLSGRARSDLESAWRKMLAAREPATK